MSGWLAGQIIFAIGYLAVYLVWSRVYYRAVDPWLRQLIGQRLGARLVWIYRQGSGDMLHFGPRYSTWMWGIEGQQGRTITNEVIVYVLSIVIVNLLAALWPAAIFFVLFLSTNLLSVWVSLPLMFLTIGIYSLYWAGRYELPGMRPHAPDPN